MKLYRKNLVRASRTDHQKHYQVGLTKPIRLALLSLLTMGSVLPATSIVASECAIDLNSNTHTCQGIPAITFVSQPANHQAVVKVNFDPKVYTHTKAIFEVSYNSSPTDWTVDICDSKSCNGYGGDAGDTSNAAEAEILNTNLNVYSNTLAGYQAATLDGHLRMLTKTNIVGPGNSK